MVRGPALLPLLETVPIETDVNHTDARFPVQYVIRPQSAEFPDYRGYAGRIAGGVFRPGDAVQVLPSGFTSTVQSVDMMERHLPEASAPLSVTLTLEDEIDISRGDMIVAADDPPTVSQDLEIMVCWLGEKSLAVGGKYTLKHTTKEVRAIVKSVDYKLDISTLDQNTHDKSVSLNEIARLTLRTTQPLFYDSYKRNRATGSVILIDEATNETVGAGMIQ